MMKKISPQKILVLVDGSDRSINTVRYVARTDPFHRMHIVLFHVFSAVPESYWDLENDIRSVKVIKHARAWEIKQRFSKHFPHDLEYITVCKTMVLCIEMLCIELQIVFEQTQPIQQA